MKFVSEFICGGFIALAMVASIFLLGIEGAQAADLNRTPRYVPPVVTYAPEAPVIQQDNNGCVFIPFPELRVPIQVPVVFFTDEAHAGCLPATSLCQKCTDWLHGKAGNWTGRGLPPKKKGGAALAVVAYGLPAGSTGVWVPVAYAQIVSKVGSWCDWRNKRDQNRTYYFYETPS